MRGHRRRDIHALNRVRCPAGRQCDRGRDIGRLRHNVPGRSRYHDLIVARIQAGEINIAGTVGHGGRNRGRYAPGHLLQRHRHARQVRLAAALAAVTVAVSIDMRGKRRGCRDDRGIIIGYRRGDDAVGADGTGKVTTADRHVAARHCDNGEGDVAASPARFVEVSKRRGIGYRSGLSSRYLAGIITD